MLTVCQELTNHLWCTLSFNPHNKPMRDNIIFPISQITEVTKAYKGSAIGPKLYSK